MAKGEIWHTNFLLYFHIDIMSAIGLQGHEMKRFYETNDDGSFYLLLLFFPPDTQRMLGAWILTVHASL